MKRASGLLFLLTIALSACDDAPPLEPKGVDVPEGPCGHALVVVGTDKNYQSTSVGVVGFDGVLLSKSIVSSASAPTGLSAALSGDVVAATSRTASEIVLIDRTPAGVLTWLDPKSANVTKQLPAGVGTNPHDYLELTADKAYVSRFDRNPKAGAEPFDQGGDVVVVDPRAPAILGRIDVAAAMGAGDLTFIPHPDRMILTSAGVVLLAPVYSKDFTKSGDSTILRIDPSTDTVTATLSLTGLRGCSGLALSPDGTTLAVACSGTFGGGSNPSLADAGIALVDTAGLSLVRSYKAANLGGQPLGFSIAFANDAALVATGFGSKETGVVDQLLHIDVATGSTNVIATSLAPFDFGEVRCVAACGACFLTDANEPKPSVRRFDVDASGALGNETDSVLETDLPLYPRYLGVY